MPLRTCLPMQDCSLSYYFVLSPVWWWVMWAQGHNHYSLSSTSCLCSFDWWCSLWERCSAGYSLGCGHLNLGVPCMDALYGKSTAWDILGPLPSTVNALDLRRSFPPEDIPYTIRGWSPQPSRWLGRVGRGIKSPWVGFLSHEQFHPLFQEC